MSGPSSFSVAFDFCAASRRACRSALPIAALVGAGGTAQTLLAPRGIAYAGGETWTARSQEAAIPPGTPIKVVGVDGLELIVEPAPAGETPAEGREAKEDPSNA